MEILLIILGFSFGVVLSYIIYSTKKAHGIISIDHTTGLCRICMTSDELANPRVSRAMFIVEHDAEISREQQLL